MAKTRKLPSSQPPPGLSSRAWRSIITWAIIALLIVIAIVVAFRVSRYTNLLAVHEPMLKDYLSVAKFGPVPANGSLKGKVVTVDYLAKAIDDLFMDLPANLQAATPDEVGTVVFLKWERQDTGLTIIVTRNGQESKQPLYEYTCSITCVDRRSKQVTAQGQVTSKLNKDKFVLDDVHEWRPKSQAIEFLSKLPNR